MTPMQPIYYEHDMEALQAERDTLRAERDALTRIEPLHGPDCPYKPFEDTYDVPEDIVCACGDLAARWKARSIVLKMERDTLRAERDVLVRQVTALQGRCDAAEAEVERLSSIMRDVEQQMRADAREAYTYREVVVEWADTLAAVLRPTEAGEELKA